ncbi:MAG: HutD family protein [Treponema sp.]
MKIEYYTKDNFHTSKWKGGKTTELLILPEGTSYKERNFYARLSSATIETSSSEFTILEGIKRFITPITHPFLLESDIKKTFLLKPFEIYEFSGEEKTSSYGISQDFNLMLNKEKADGWMKVAKWKTEVEIDLENEIILWFFCPCVSANLIIGTNSKIMEKYSLLTIKELKEKRIKFSTTQTLIFGGIKAIFKA